MEPLIEYGGRPMDARKVAVTRARDHAREIAFPATPIHDQPKRPPARAVSAAQVAELVLVALEDALTALDRPDPEAWLQLHACEAHDGMRTTLSVLPRFLACDETVQREFRKAMMARKFSLELALSIADTVVRFAKVCERENAAEAA